MKKSFLLSLAATLGLPVFLLSFTDAVWNGGDWNDEGNWTYHSTSHELPNGIDATVRFQGAEGINGLGQTITVGHVVVTDGTPEFDSPDNFIFSVSSGNATCTGFGTGGFHLFNNSAITLSSPLTIRSGGSDFSFAGYFTGDQDLTVTGGPFRYFVQANNPPSTPFTGNLNIDATGVINIDALDVLNEPPVFGGLTGRGELISHSFVVVNSVNPSTFNGTLNGSMGSAIIKQGAATLTLNGVGSMDSIVCDEGTLSVTSLNNLANPNILFFFSGLFGPPSPKAVLNIKGNSPFTYPNTVIFGNGGISEINIDPSTALTLSGPMFDNGSATVHKTGHGELTISGNPVFNAPITVLEGILTITGSIGNPLAVNGGIFNVPGSVSGETNVNQGGVFNIDGSASGTTFVNSGGVLKGTGSLQTVTVNPGGMISPGHSIGTLNVATLNLTSDSVTQIEISPTASSQILVSGVATLAGTVNVVQQKGTYPTSGSYQILIAGLTSAFYKASVPAGGLPGYSFTLDLDPVANTVLLLYDFTGIPTAKLTGQAEKFARYLNRNIPTSSAMQTLLQLPENEQQAALDSASPSRNAFVPFAVQNTLFSLSNLISGHLIDQRFYHAQTKSNPNVADLMDKESSFTADASGRMAMPRTHESQSVWLGAMGEYAHQDALDQNTAFNFWSGGSMIGWDFYGDRNLCGCGAGAAYTHLVQDENTGNAKINYYFASLYDTFYSPGDLYLELAFLGVYNQIHNYRNIFFPGFAGVASATFNSWELVSHFGIGCHATYDQFSFDPFAQFDLVVDWQQGFQEHGVGDFDMTYVSRNSQFLRSEGGLRLYWVEQASWGSWMAMVKTSYVNKKAFNTGAISASIVGTNALFSVETFRNTQNLGSLGLEFLWRWGQTKPLTLSFAFNGEVGSKYWSQEGMVRLIKDF